MGVYASCVDEEWRVCEGGSLHAKGRSLWLICSLDAQTPLIIDGPAGRESLEPANSVHLLGIARNAKVFIDSPGYRCSEVCVATLAKLIAFIDFGMRAQDADAKSLSSRAVSSVFIARGFTTPDAEAIQREFIGRILADDALDQPLLLFLRTSEAYWVVSFLLEQFAANKRVSDLGALYGLSNAHFRRLCKIALGGSLKAELKRWRAASAVLRIVESEQTLTDIALEAGFASSSHLSREIKGLLGVPPSHIWHFGIGKMGTKARAGDDAEDGVRMCDGELGKRERGAMRFAGWGR
ncbi:MAG: helix-turn-helix domain-containing protein [Pararobbsia sp.]